MGVLIIRILPFKVPIVGSPIFGNPHMPSLDGTPGLRCFAEGVLASGFRKASNVSRAFRFLDQEALLSGSVWSDGAGFDVWSIEKADFKPSSRGGWVSWRVLGLGEMIAGSARGRGVRARSVHDDLPGARGRCLWWCSKQT